MKKLLIFSWIVIGIMGLVACSDNTATSSEESLVNSDWILESFGDKDNQKIILTGTEITLTFDSSDGRVRGSSGCNTYGGAYIINETTLTIRDLANTEMGCIEPEGIMEQETQYLRILSQTEKFNIENDKLQITAGDQLLIYNAIND